jgi:hypothetical protein
MAGDFVVSGPHRHWIAMRAATPEPERGIPARVERREIHRRSQANTVSPQRKVYESIYPVGFASTAFSSVFLDIEVKLQFTQDVIADLSSPIHSQ